MITCPTREMPAGPERENTSLLLPNTVCLIKQAKMTGRLVVSLDVRLYSYSCKDFLAMNHLVCRLNSQIA